MDMYKIKWTRLQNEIFRFFCIKAGMSINQRGVARALKVSPTAISNSLNELVKENLINVKKDQKMNLILIEFNRDSQKAIDMKRVENLRLIYESELVKFLYESFPGATIILFGSYSKGEDTIYSDIDIAIIGAKEKEINLAKFDKLFEKTIILNYYKSFKDIHKSLRENIYNGILLKGGVEL